MAHIACNWRMVIIARRRWISGARNPTGREVALLTTPEMLLYALFAVDPPAIYPWIWIASLSMS